MTERKTTSGIPELALLILLLLLAAFIGGAVLVVNAAVADGGFAASGRGVEAMGEEALDRIESMARAAARFSIDSPPGASGNRALRVGYLDFLVDLDGDPATGSFRAGEKRGLERVLISASGSGLTADVFSSVDSEPRPVALSLAAELSEPGCFVVEYVLDGAEAVALRLSVTAGRESDGAAPIRRTVPVGPVPVGRAPRPE